MDDAQCIYSCKSLRISDVNAEVLLNGMQPDIVRDDAIVVRAMAVEPGKTPSEVITNTYFFESITNLEKAMYFHIGKWMGHFIKKKLF